MFVNRLTMILYPRLKPTAATTGLPARRTNIDSVRLRRCCRCKLRGLHNASLRERRRDLLHAINKIDGCDGRQYQAADWIAAAGDLRIGFYLVETGDA